MNFLPNALTRPLLAFAALAALSSPALAQNPKLQLDSLSRLESKASRTIDVTIDRELMGLASRALSSEKGANADKVRDLIAGIQEIYVRGYEFDTEGAFDKADVDAIRAQVSGPGWSRISSVRTRKGIDNAEVYVMHGAGKVKGLVILVSEPKELTVVNIVGEIDPERLSELDGDFGIPRIELKRDTGTKPAPEGRS